MTPTKLAYNVFDAFTATRFRGNPAAVILLQPDHGLSDTLMQLIGREFNLSETAFVVPLEDHCNDAPHFSLRWFTPEVEAPLCGHATLAAACYLHLSHPELKPPYRFESRLAGQPKVDYHAAQDLYELDFPADIPVALAPVDIAAAMEKAYTWFPNLANGDITAVLRAGRGYLVEVSETVDVSSVVYDTAAIARDAGQCALTAAHAPTAEDPSQVHSRLFAPGSGIIEDPVTGSAHTRIVPYWLSKWDGTALKCRQVSPRGGELDTMWLRDEGRVLLRGHCAKTAEGVLFL
ncbi:Diaminopimelate epimerase-like protein [Mycena sanguinolenta]|uniref:Diaminopimelate epimerase-like protein n=1 Tax=Mycena sanguinolenta TaxID=230812 RepID=A0A8H7DCL9_9AGAR|nr:Diaminopimelate epimerase-like protein [Mycena sanguinolenta]